MSEGSRVAAPPERPLLVFDGECGFCRRWLARWRQTTRDEVDHVPFQAPELPARFPELNISDCRRAVHLVEPDGAVTSGAEAVFRSWSYGGRSWSRWAYETVPGFAPGTEIGYRLVADHRSAADRVTVALWGASVERAGLAHVRGLFLRLVGAIYLVAFASLWPQLSGLIGSTGILPVPVLLDAARGWGADRELGWQIYRVMPTLFWLNASDWALHAACGSGVLLSALVVAGIAPAALLFVLWILYLSLAIVGREFLSYQWDALLLEVGLLAVLFAPLAWRLRAAEPSRAAHWLLKWLLFRLMFGSGVVKLASGDPVWRDLTALTYHYQTQPLPNAVSWYVHHAPVWMHQASAAGMFAVELVAPFLVFAPRRIRLDACGAMVALQGLIALTGNYGFFAPLTIALCLTLVDDRWLARWTGIGSRAAPPANGEKPPRNWPLAAVAAAAVVILIVSSMELAWAFRERVRWPAPMAFVYQLAAPLRSINGYGLFAVMTTTRPEIVVEGSDDGNEWRAYEFEYKPGDRGRPPPFVAPHQPRLDWQMWFAALDTYDRTPWVGSLCRRLLEGSPAVLELLAVNPFPDRPPRFVRAALYEYRFTTPAERRETGRWWARQERGMYVEALSLNR